LRIYSTCIQCTTYLKSIARERKFEAFFIMFLKLFITRLHGVKRREDLVCLQIDCLQYRLLISLLLTVRLHTNIIVNNSTAYMYFCAQIKISKNEVTFVYMYYCLRLDCLHVLYSVHTILCFKNTNFVLKHKFSALKT